MRLVLILSFLLFSFSILSQVLKVEIKDAKTGDPIQNVSVTPYTSSNDSVTSITTNGRGLGFFQSKISRLGDTLLVGHPILQFKGLKCSHPIYQSLNKNISGNSFLDVGDTILISIFLQPIKHRELKEIRLNAPGKADTVFGSEKFSILDFELLQDGKLILLMYPKTRENATELLYLNNQEVLHHFTSKFPMNKLLRDYQGNIHAIGDEFVNGIKINNNQIETAQVPLNYYIKYLAPLVDTTVSKLYISNFNKLIPAFEYYAMDKQDSTYMLVTNIRDDLMMTLYRSEIKWVDVRTKLWAKQKELETGIDAEIWVGANYFTQSIYWEEIYAPLFTRNDSVFVVNYPKDLLEIFDANGKNIKKVPIFHHYQRSKTGFKRKLIQDNVTGAIYAVFEKAGVSHLGYLNVQSGQITEKVKLNFKYIDQIRVYNNEAYYIYRPFESSQKRFLYKERLPYSFGKASLNQGTEMSIDTGR